MAYFPCDRKDLGTLPLHTFLKTNLPDAFYSSRKPVLLCGFDPWQSMESKVDDVWGQLKAMVELSASVQDDETVCLARSSWLSFSSALAACVQDSGSGSSSTMTR